MGLVAHVLKQHLMSWRARRQTVSLVTVNGRSFKRVRCQDATRGRDIAECLQAFGPSPHVPTLVAAKRNEVWVDYVDGERLPVNEDRGAEAVRTFYRHLYHRQAHKTALATTRVPDRLWRDLWVLDEIGALDRGESDRILSEAEAVRPETVWLGFDYVDARTENFILRHDGTAVGIDVENFTSATLLGTGLASLSLHWPRKAERTPGIERLLESDDLFGIARQFPYVALCYQAARSKRRMLKRKAAFRDGEVAAALHEALRPRARAWWAADAERV